MQEIASNLFMTPAKETAAKSVKKTAGKKAAPQKSAHKKTAQEADHCWPGFQPVAGKMSGEKGSCERKTSQTKHDKLADSKAAAAARLEKAGGRTSRANSR